MKVLILIYTLCGDPQYITVLDEGVVATIPPEVVPLLIQKLEVEDKIPVTARIELDEVLGGQCS